MPNLRKFSARDFVADIPSKWWNFVANFYNTVIGIGVAFVFTDNGIGCEVSTIGHTGKIIIDSEVSGEQHLMNVADGRTISDNLIYSPTNEATDIGTPFDETYQVYGGGFIFMILDFDTLIGVPNRLLITDGDGGILYDTGVVITHTFVPVNIPTETDEIRVQISTTPPNDSWRLNCEYRNA